MDINEHVKNGTVKKTINGKELAQSLLAMADIKEQTVMSVTLTESNISAYIPMAYDSLREVLDALCILNGYKPQSHIHTGEIAKTLYTEFDFISFDRFRYARNRINYYGEKIELQQGKDFIQKIIQMKKEVEKQVKKLLENEKHDQSKIPI